MPPRWHWLRLRTTCHPTEDVARVRAALQACTGLDDDGFAKVLTETALESHHGGEVVVLEASLERARDVRGALALLSAADKARLAAEVDPRTDDSGVFHFRVGKQAAFAGNVAVTTGDDALQVRLKPEVHPASRDAAMAAVTQWFAGEA